MLAEFEESMRTSRNRRRCLIMLASLTEATPRQLAQALGIGETRLLALMQGDGVDYSFDRSLLALGLAEARLTPKGSRVYMISEKGRRKARQLTSRDARAAIARARRTRAGTRHRCRMRRAPRHRPYVRAASVGASPVRTPVPID